MRNLSLATLLVSVCLITSCGAAGVKVAYTPPAVPLTVEIDSHGNISVSIAKTFTGPWGTVTIAADVESDRLSEFDFTLDIRLDGQDHVYGLKGGTAKKGEANFASTFYRLLNIYWDEKSVLIIAARMDGATPPPYVRTAPTAAPRATEVPNRGNASLWTETTIPPTKHPRATEVPNRGNASLALCGNAPVSRLSIGSYAKISASDLPNVLNSAPASRSGGARTLYEMYSVQNARLHLVDGPVCDGQHLWWKVWWPLKGGVYGWTPEGEDGIYWLDPN